ncbi:C6 transcription factor [Rasamsonia emersonii CBS 393.64]|uniref:C6 transcription factor n=1 Tax=Rasamsonia emersonii (strain ATCC 16479 / CBS 393.64 / IMI 116815) TaxID=1408163 RepID=A0A0F4YX34_RASE3|nr:C6 transcription factor [Rasamsonia emersonii CBS 393.64]KKA22872.1 C6 transcription factor [Rasamsonia emersonii CBS 393.64]
MLFVARISIDQTSGLTRTLQCDNCRARKIKCDKRSPCSNCRASNTVCHTANRPKEHRQRILISSQYEKKIEAIESRLARIEGLIQNLAAHSAASPSRPSVTLGPSYSPHQETLSSSGGPAERNSSAGKTNTAFEGDSSLRAHSVHASRVVEHAMRSDASVDRSPEMQEALAALRTLIEKQHALSINQDWRFPNQPANAAIDLSSVKMPSLSSVVTLLRLCKESHNFLDLPFLDFDQFNELCKKIYFAVEDYSLAAFTLVNGGLYYLFLEVGMLWGRNVPESQESAAICRANFEYALGRFDIFTAPTFENIQALLLGASYAIDISRPSLCWALTSTAARLCQTLGYHRSVASPDDRKLDIQLKKRMFWYTYILDKSLSLRLGHSSTLQDFDITLDLPELSPDTRLSMWEVMYQHWIRIGRFQGRIYEELYSPQALSGSSAEMTRRAKSIISDMQMWYREILQIDPSRAYNPAYYEAAITSCEIMYYSLLTLVYRTIPPGPTDSSTIFNNECIETARLALKAHQRNSERYKDSNSYIWHGYISWILMNCPFTPFLVLFCHAIATADTSDLRRLGEFVSSLQSAAEVAEAAEKFCRLCHVFHRVAELYISAKMRRLQEQQQQQVNSSLGRGSSSEEQQNLSNSSNSNINNNNRAASAGNNSNPPPPQYPGLSSPIDDLEPYLSALGIPNAAVINTNTNNNSNNNSDPTAMTTAAGFEQGFTAGDSSSSLSLGNWFAGNVNIMSLLETDLSSVVTPVGY